VFVGEGVVLGQDDSDFADGARLEGSDGCSGALADLMDGEVFDFAEADDEETLGLEAVGIVQEEGFAESGFEFAGSEDFGRGMGDGVRGCEQSGERLGIFACGDIYGKDCKERGCKSSSILKCQA